MSGASSLIVGLGNPGPEYEKTPHNLGFMTIDRLGEMCGISVRRPGRNALVGEGRIEGRAVALAKPLSYMNLSGGVVRALLQAYELGPPELVIIYDELDLPFGSIRIRKSGSSAGHNGMESIIAALETKEFTRVRLGIAPDHPVKDGAGFVLRPFRRSQQKELEELVGRAAEAVRSIIAEGASKAMTKYNRRAQG